MTFALGAEKVPIDWPLFAHFGAESSMMDSVRTRKHFIWTKRRRWLVGRIRTGAGCALPVNVTWVALKRRPTGAGVSTRSVKQHFQMHHSDFTI